MDINLETFINQVEPHKIRSAHPPHDFKNRHVWESKLLYSVVNKLFSNCSLIDLGCGGQQTMKYSLFNRFPDSKYYGIDPTLNNMEDFPSLVKKVDCCVAGSVFTHLDFSNIKKILNTLKPMFDRGREFGFTFFLDTEELHYGPNWYKDSNTWHVATTTVNQYEEYCENHGLKFKLLPFDHTNHTIHLKDKPGDNKFVATQNFANISKE